MLGVEVLVTSGKREWSGAESPADLALSVSVFGKYAALGRTTLENEVIVRTRDGTDWKIPIWGLV